MAFRVSQLEYSMLARRADLAGCTVGEWVAKVVRYRLHETERTRNWRNGNRQRLNEWRRSYYRRLHRDEVNAYHREWVARRKAQRNGAASEEGAA